MFISSKKNVLCFVDKYSSTSVLLLITTIILTVKYCYVHKLQFGSE